MRPLPSSHDELVRGEQQDRQDRPRGDQADSAMQCSGIISWSLRNGGSRSAQRSSASDLRPAVRRNLVSSQPDLSSSTTERRIGTVSEGRGAPRTGDHPLAREPGVDREVASTDEVEDRHFEDGLRTAAKAGDFLRIELCRQRRRFEIARGIESADSPHDDEQGEQEDESHRAAGNPDPACRRRGCARTIPCDSSGVRDERRPRRPGGKAAQRRFPARGSRIP